MLRRAVFAWFLLLAGLPPAWSEVRTLTILHTNDLHARFLPDSRGEGGFAHLAAVIRREREGCSWCIYMSAGDLVQGTPVSTLFRGMPVFEVANLFPPDVFTLGNHEFDYGWRRTLEFLRKARFAVVSANVVDDEGRLLAREPYVIRKVNGLRVAIIGALTADLPHLTTPGLLGPWKALPVVETVRRYAKEVHDRADVIVALGHIAPDEEDNLLAQAPEVPVIVSGHLHRGLDEAKRQDGRIVVRVRGYGVELGRLDLEVDTEKKGLASAAWRRIPVRAAGTPAAPDVARAVDRWEKKVSEIVDVAIGESRREFSIPEVKTLMERAMAEKTGADFAYMNKGGIRDVLPKGRILARHIWNIMPFDNNVVVGTFRGSDLPAVIRNGNPIDPNREYSLAVPDFVAANQQKELGVNGLRFPKVGPLQRDLLIAWLKEKKVLD